MSKPVNVQVLEKAIDIWKDPKARYEGYISADRTRFCAMGVINHAALQVTGEHWGLDRCASLIGYHGPTAIGHVGAINDLNLLGLGRSYLYRQMKKQLAALTY